MTSRVIEAKLVISGEDRASQIIEKITKATKQFARDADMSAAMRKNAEAAAKTEQAFNAVAKAMSGREGFAKAQADAKAAETGLHQYTKALDAARQAKAAFGNVRPAKGSEEAAAYAAAAKGLREATVAQQRAAREVDKTSTAMRGQAAAMKDADRAAASLGADLSNLAGHQQKLRSTFEASTAAIARQAAMEERAGRVSQARQARMDAVKGAAGIIGIGAVHKAEHFAGHALHTYQHFDNERRFGKVVMDLTDEEQKPLVDQAIHMGAISRYNDVKVLHAQRELAARGLNRDQVLGMIPHVKDLGQALDIDIGDAAKQIEAGIFAFKKDIGTLEAATKSAQQTADIQVKAAKISGMTPEDIKQAYKYGATPARLAKVSEERMLAFAGVLKKATIGGDEAGVAFRALMSMTNAPTAGAKVAMRAAGLDYNNYQKKPEKLAVDPFVKQVAESYGVKLDGTVQAGLRRIFSNKALIGDSTKFTPAVMDLLGDNLGGDDAKSKKSIAGLANRYRNASMQGVDSNRLIDDLLLKLRDNLAFANALFGSKQGGRIATALSDPETFKKMQGLLGADHSAGYAAKVSEARMAGFDGAVKRFQGAVTNLETKLGRAWDNDGEGGALTDITSKAGQFVQHLAEMDNATVRTASVVAAAGTAFVGLKSIGLLQSGFGLKTSAVALDNSAAALTAAAVKLGGGSLGGLPGAPGADGKKTTGGKLKSAAKIGAGIAGAVALEPLAEEAQRRHIFEMPDIGKDGWLRSGLNLLDPNAGDLVLGDRAKALPSMGLKPGEVPLTIGRDTAAFGLNGPVNPDPPAPALPQRAHRRMIDAEAAEREATRVAPSMSVQPSQVPPAIDRRSAAFGLAGAIDPDAPVPALPQRAHPKMIDAEAAEREAREAGTKAGDVFNRSLVMVPLPPPRPDAFDPMKTAAGEAGALAGERAGRGIAEGVQTQAPAVEQQGRSIMQRLQEMFSAGIFVPIHLKPGEGMDGGAGAGGGLIQTASFGAEGGGGVLRRGGAGIDSGGGSGGGSGSGSGHTVPRGAFGPGTGAGDSWYEATMRAEGTAGKDPYNVVLGNGRYGLPNKPLTDMSLAEAYRFGRTVRARHGSSSALGAFQIVGRTMKAFMGEAGLSWDDKFSPENQRKLADVIQRRQGFGAWEGFKSHRGELGNARRLQPLAPTVRADEPRLLKGLDGREGLDLGDGTMKMPNGSIRSIPRGGPPPEPPAPLLHPAVPDAPPSGIDTGRAGMGLAADKMLAAAERIEGSGFHGQIQLAVTGGGRDQVRVTGVKAQGRGAVSADMGITMPGAKEDAMA